MSFYNCGTCGGTFTNKPGESLHCPQCAPARELSWRTVLGGLLRMVADRVDPTPPLPAATYQPWGGGTHEA